MNARHTATGPTKATTANGPTKCEHSTSKGYVLAIKQNLVPYSILDIPVVPISLELLPSLSYAELLANLLNKLLLLLGKGVSCWHPTHTPQ